MARLNEMKSESLKEARERLREQSQLENEGFEAVSEGQLVGRRMAVDDGRDEDYTAEVHEAVEADRARRSLQDRPDADAVDWQRQAMSNGPDAQVNGEGAKPARRSSRKAARKSDGE